MTTIPVNASHPYEVQIERGLLNRLGVAVKPLARGTGAAVVSDTNVAPLYMERALHALHAAGFDAAPFIFPAGEQSKCGETYLALLEFLASRRLTRADLVVALGGGVTGDLTGFAAATYLRGIGFVQVPTTLLACVDSSVGGKTAIDLKAGKNLAGAFYPPRRVICDPALLDTLPDAVFSEGCAEVIKHGMIASPELLKRLREKHAREQLEYVIAKNVEMKRDVVESDEFDTGARQILNLGHTFGHAVEALSGYQTPHGRAVAIGMAIITRAAVRKGICPKDCLDVLLELLEKHGLPAETAYSARELAELAQLDKKRAGDTVTLAVPTGLGESRLMPVPADTLIDWAKAGLDA